MEKLMIFVLFCCSVVFLQCNADNSKPKRGYVFTIPYKLPIGGNTTGCVSLQNTEPPANIVTELLHQNKVVSSASYNLAEGAKACLNLSVPMIKTPDAVVRLTIKFAKHPDYVVKDERKVEISLNSRLVFVQTDKGIYKPDEEVNIRILQLHQDLTPVKDLVSEIIMKNPSNNKIMEWTKMSTSNGMTQFKFFLATGAKLGRWMIMVKMYPNIPIYAVTDFEVRSEGFTNFEIKIIPPRYILADAVKLTWKICVSYNYDVPAKGTLVTRLTPYAPNWPNPSEETIEKIQLNSPDGCTEIATSGAVFNLNRWSVLPEEMVLSANFTDAITGMTQSEVSRTPILYETIKLKFAPTMDKYFKLDAPYEGKLLVSGPDDSPLPNERIELCLETSGRDDFVRHVHECRNFTSSSEGSIDFIVPSQHRNSTSLTFVASAVNWPTKYYFVDEHWKTFMNQPTTQIKLYPLYSASNSYVVVTQGKERLTCGKNYSFNVMYTLPQLTDYNNSIIFHYSVNSRSGILLDEQKIHKANVDTILDYSQFDNLLGSLKTSVNRFYMDPLVHRFRITIKITPNMAPLSELLVYYVRSDGEIVSASHTMDVGYCFNNDVRTEWNTTDVQVPGSPIKYKVQAAPDSLCGVSFVEKPSPNLPKLPFTLLNSYQIFESVKGNNPISMNGIMLQSGCNDTTDSENELEVLENRVDIGYGGSIQYVNEMQAFNDFGTVVMTNMKQTTQRCSQSYTVKPPDPKTNSPGSVSRTKSLDEISMLKSHFPKTWLWDMMPLKNESNITSEHTLPDKRADWNCHTVCISPKYGLGMAPMQLVRTRRPFFFDYDLPPVSKVGEMIILNATIFNYMDRTIPVTVNMKLEGIDTTASKLNVSFCVAPKDTVVYEYFIIPRNIGTFYAVADVFIDKNLRSCDGSNVPDSWGNITKPIEVIGKGFAVEESTTAMLCLVNASVDLTYTFNVTYPKDIIEGSQDGTLFLVGNVLGLTPDNLKKLVKVPTGCGEQNIAVVVPNIFMITFIDTMKIKNVVIRKNAIQNLERGYQTQHNFRRDDGSYSTFVNYPSSIWLTAFVLKAFALAQKYIYISATDLQQTVDWLVEKQLPNGCFPMIGTLVHKDMRGGLEKDDSSAAMTVYILISLLESGLDIPKSTINNAVFCIEREKGYLNSSLYTKIMTTYALTLLKHPYANATVKEMLKIAHYEEDTMYWKDNKNPSLSSSIEMTSFMILSLINFGNEIMNNASKAIRWTLKHRNSDGGFVSTQDTALALQAITMYAMLGSSKSVDLSILVSAEKLDRTYILKDNDYMMPLYVRLPKIPTTLEIFAEGYGCVVAQTNVKYSILPRTNIHFFLSATVRSIVAGDCDILELAACVRYIGKYAYTNMAIIEIGMLTGYEPDRESLELLNTLRKIDKYEFKNNDLHLYFEKLDKKETCVSFKIRRRVRVNNLLPSNIRVYDYYVPEVSEMTTYMINPECNKTVEIDNDKKLTILIPIKYTSKSSFIYSPETREWKRLDPPIKRPDTATTVKPWTRKKDDKTKNDTALADCPVCIEKLPSDIRDVYCSAKCVIKVGIRKWRKVRTLMDLSPHRKVKRVRTMIEFNLNPNCTCFTLDTPGILGLIINKNEDIFSTGNRKQSLTNSYYMYVLPQIDDVPCEIADARVTCSNEEKLACT